MWSFGRWSFVPIRSCCQEISSRFCYFEGSQGCAGAKEKGRIKASGCSSTGQQRLGSLVEDIHLNPCVTTTATTVHLAWILRLVREWVLTVSDAAAEKSKSAEDDMYRRMWRGAQLEAEKAPACWLDPRSIRSVDCGELAAG